MKNKFGLKITRLSICCDEEVITGIGRLCCSKCLKEVGKRVGKLYYKIK